jgi:hypothetical protein
LSRALGGEFIQTAIGAIANIEAADGHMLSHGWPQRL